MKRIASLAVASVVLAAACTQAPTVPRARTPAQPSRDGTNYGGSGNAAPTDTTGRSGIGFGGGN